MRRSAGNYYSLVRNEPNPAKALRYLKNKVAPSDYAQKDELSRQYKAHLEPVQANKVEAWVLRWDWLYPEMSARDMIEAQGIAPFERLIQAVSKIDRE